MQVLSRKLGRSPEDIIKLDANENPYGPPKEVLEALAGMPFPHIYPDPECRALRSKLAALNDTPEQNILVRDRSFNRPVLRPGSVSLYLQLNIMVKGGPPKARDDVKLEACTLTGVVVWVMYLIVASR